MTCAHAYEHSYLVVSHIEQEARLVVATAGVGVGNMLAFAVSTPNSIVLGYDKYQHQK